MNRILILFAHPALEKSRVNRQLMEEVRSLPGVTFHDLYEVYPDFQIDAKREQRLVEEHDVVIFQHPFYWYSSPAILKEWQDLVLEYGYAYGTGGTAFLGKLMLNAITTGGPREAYRPEGNNRFTVRQFLAPFDQTAHLCRMIYLAPFVIHRSLFITTSDAGRPFASDYRRLIETLRDGGLDIEAARKAERINDLLPGFIPGKGNGGAA